MAYHIQWLSRGLIRTLKGTLTIDDFLRSNNEIFGSEHFDSMRYMIVDFREVEVYHATMLDVRRVAYLDKAAAKSNPRIKVAVVGMEVTHEYFEEYLKVASDNAWVVRSFHTIEEAQTWLLDEVPALSISDFPE